MSQNFDFNKGDIVWIKNHREIYRDKILKRMWDEIFSKTKKLGPFTVLKYRKEYGKILVRYWWGFIPLSVEVYEDIVVKRIQN